MQNEDIKVIADFQAGYGRTGEITVEIDKCCVCRADTVVICIDSSEGEYGNGCICLTCATEAVNEFSA